MALAILKIVAIVAAGAGGGFLLSRLLCAGGGCPITSNRGLMIAMGAGIGLYAAYTFGWFAAATGAPAGPPLPALRTDAELSQALAGERLVVLDFYADWCGPCRRMKPVLAQARQEWAARADFYAINVDHAPELAQRFGVESIPTLVFMRSGVEAGRAVGLLTAGQLSARLGELAGPPPANVDGGE